MLDFSSCPKVDYIFPNDKLNTVVRYQNRLYMIKPAWYKMMPPAYYLSELAKGHRPEMHRMANQFTEDIGCKIYSLLGFQAQKTFLVQWKNLKGEKEIAVACELFTQHGETFYPFDLLVFAVLGESKSEIEISTAVQILNKATQIRNSDREKIKQHFWDMFLVDGWLGNKDRNLSNWGFLLRSDSSLDIAPIFDCASSLSPWLFEEEIQRLLIDSKGLKTKVCRVQSWYHRDGKRILFIEAMQKPDVYLKKSIIRIVPIIKKKLAEIFGIIDEMPCLSDARKEFMKRSLQVRYECILRPALERSTKID